MVVPIPVTGSRHSLPGRRAVTVIAPGSGGIQRHGRLPATVGHLPVTGSRQSLPGRRLLYRHSAREWRNPVPWKASRNGGPHPCDWFPAIPAGMTERDMVRLNSHHDLQIRMGLELRDTFIVNEQLAAIGGFYV